MHIEKLSVKDREVTVSLSADEIVKLCKCNFMDHLRRKRWRRIRRIFR